MGAMFSALAGCGDRVLTSIGDASPTADVAEMSDASLADGTRDAEVRTARADDAHVAPHALVDRLGHDQPQRIGRG